MDEDIEILDEDEFIEVVSDTKIVYTENEKH